MVWHLSLLLMANACLPVGGDRILMRDLAAAIPAFAGADGEESIGFAPAAGAQRRFSAGEVSRLATLHGMAQDNVMPEAQPVCFERKLEALTRERLLAALHEALPGNAHVELADFSRVNIPRGTLEFLRGGLVPAPLASPRDPMIWRGLLRYATAQSVPVWAKVAVWVSKPGVLASQSLPPGKPIAAGEVRIAQMDLSPFAEAPAASVEDVAGLAPRRPIREGQAVLASWLETPAEVTRGEMVGIEARYGLAFLKFQVRAESSGRVGDAIQVRNVESGRTFRARVIRKGWVAVE